MSYDSVAGHRSMALDAVRNTAYRDALHEVITPESVVLDLGAGLGTLGLLAAKAGARRVYLVEPSDVIAVAREIVDANGLSDRVDCLQGSIESVTLPEKVDVITSVMAGNFLLSEDLLPTLFLARDRWLKPGGHLLPSAATMRVAPVSAPGLHEREVGCWSTPHLGLKLDPVRAYAANSLVVSRRLVRAATPLAAPADLATLDFTCATSTACEAAVEVTAHTDATCHGWLGWFDMRLGAHTLSTAPTEPRTHWASLLLPVDPPFEVSVDERLAFDLKRPPSGDWSWEVHSPRETREHSTFFSRPLTRDTLRRAAPDSRPHCSVEGDAARYVLERMDGNHTLQDLSTQLSSAFGERFPSTDEAMVFVLDLVRRLG